MNFDYEFIAAITLSAITKMSRLAVKSGNYKSSNCERAFIDLTDSWHLAHLRL